MAVRHTVGVLAAVLAFVATVPASASAGWSAPADVGGGGHPALWMGADARSRIVAGDQVRTWIAFGDRTNRFSAPVDLAAGIGQMLGGAGVAPRADGSALVALIEAGCPSFAVHCDPAVGPWYYADALRAVVVRADGSRSTVTTLATAEDLRGNPTPPAPVAEPGGRWAVAWAGGTNTGAGYRYRVRYAAAAPGGAFGGPVTLAETSARPGGVDADAGAGGVAAVAWLQPQDTAGGPTRAWVAVRPTSAAPFGAPELVSDPGGATDQSVGTLVGEDGTVTVAWQNPNGLFVRDRSPDGTWGAAQQLAPAANPGFDIVNAPSGGMAVTWSQGYAPDSGASTLSLHLAQRPRGGAFSAQDIATSGGGFSASLGLDAGGTAYAAWLDPQPAGIVVATRPPGGGWSPPLVLSADRGGPVLATGPPALATVAWGSERDGGIVVATTFSPSNAGLPTPATTPAPGSDRRPPRATLGMTGTRLGSRMRVTLACDEPCTVTATAVLSAGSVWAPLSAIVDRTAGRTHRLAFRVPARTARRLRRAGKPIRLEVKVRVRDRAGNAVALRRIATLHR